MSQPTYLPCAHCGVEFPASKRQLKRHRARSGSHRFYCSIICQFSRSNQGRPRTRPWLELGPCPTCGKMFTSLLAGKKFCSLACYTKSPQFKAMVAANTHKARERAGGLNALTCRECGNQFYSKPSSKRRYCSMLCYRRFQAKRFDRWIASPQSLALPQNYDEFLTQDELPCLVEGCSWRGHFLSGHMNFAHGVPAPEFKRAAGFNLKSGIISPSLFEAMAARPHIHEAVFPARERLPVDKIGEAPEQTRNYQSLEGREHRRKARALESEGSTRVCRSCGETFRQSTPSGLTKYCSTRCRTAFYYYTRGIHSLTCVVCGKSFRGKAHRVACSIHCRQVLNSRAARNGYGLRSMQRHR